MARLVVDRATAGADPSQAAPDKLDAPTIAAIRVMFGVGRGHDVVPDAVSFKPVYTLQIPVFALGALDSDGVHEMDAVAFLEMLQTRALQRKWAARLELEIHQPAASVAHADLEVDTSYADDNGPTLSVADRDPLGTTIAGGARSLTLRSSLAHGKDQVMALGGTFELRVNTGDKQSAPRKLQLHLGRFEFQPG